MTSTTCTDAWRWRVSDYHDGGVTGAERAEIEAHIATCAACQGALASYDQLYRQLRTLPGFEGMLTVTKPGNRRGIGGTARPTFTWPGHSVSGSQRRASGSGGSIAIALVLLVAIALLLGRGTEFFTPQSPHVADSFTTTPVPTMGSKTVSGVPCANDEAEYAQSYLYSDANGLLWRVQQCQTPAKVTTLPFTDFRLGPVAPDGQNLTIITPAAQTAHAHLYDYSVKAGKLRELSGASSTPALPTDVQDLAWLNSTTLIVLASGHLYSQNIISNTTTPLAISATQIAWRNQQLFYSVLSQGQIVLHTFDLTSKADTVVFNFGTANQVCSLAGICSLATMPWDLTSVGDSVVYPAIGPAPGGVTTGLVSGVYAANLKSGSRMQIATLPVAAAIIQRILVAPDNLHVAVQWPDTSPTGEHLKIVSMKGGKALDVPGGDGIAWRSDANALVLMPATVLATSDPKLLLINTSHTLDLPTKTLNYIWLPTN